MYVRLLNSAFLLAFASMGAIASAASGDTLHVGPAGSEGLPDLPASDAASPWRLQQTESGAGLVYRTGWEKWSGRIFAESGARPSFRITHGRRLSARLGAGARIVRDGDSSEILLNGLYLHRPNLRVRMSAVQQRESDGSGGAGTTQYAGYFLSLEKTWDKGFRRAGGISWHMAEDSSPASAPATDEVYPFAMQETSARSGKTHAIRLNLTLQPLPKSILQLEYLTRLGTGGRSSESAYAGDGTYRRLGYAQQLENCIELSSSVVDSTDTNELEIGMAHERWSVHGFQELNGNRASGIFVSYAVPLDHSPNSTSCDDAAYARRRVQLMDAVTQGVAGR